MFSLSLTACATGGQFDQLRAKVLNNFQETELKISPDLGKQAKIENAMVFSAGMTLNVGLDITAPRDCGMLVLTGGFFSKDGTKVSSLNGALPSYSRGEKAHLVMNPTNTAPLINMQSAVAMATIDKLQCM